MLLTADNIHDFTKADRFVAGASSDISEEMIKCFQIMMFLRYFFVTTSAVFLPPFFFFF